MAASEHVVRQLGVVTCQSLRATRVNAKRAIRLVGTNFVRSFGYRSCRFTFEGSALRRRVALGRAVSRREARSPATPRWGIETEELARNEAESA